MTRRHDVTNMMLDPISQLMVVNRQQTERRRDAADAGLSRIAARAQAQARKVTESLRRQTPAREARVSHFAEAAGRRG
jgi:hypothetical protein